MRREDVACVNSRTANTEREGGGGRVMQRRIDKEGGENWIWLLAP